MKIVRQILDWFKQYIDNKIKLIKLDLIALISSLMSNLIFVVVCLLMFFCVLFFSGLALSEVFCDSGISRSGSYFLTSGIYVFFLLLTVAMQKSITGFFSNIFIKNITKDTDDDTSKL